jgi:hypothetical protein
MTRFTASRWNRILIWTGAALAWGTALVAAKIEPAREGRATASPPSTAPATSLAPLPEPPSSGLVILRYTPVEQPGQQVRKVYVQRQAPPSGGSASAGAAPAPASSGS